LYAVYQQTSKHHKASSVMVLPRYLLPLLWTTYKKGEQLYSIFLIGTEILHRLRPYIYYEVFGANIAEYVQICLDVRWWCTQFSSVFRILYCIILHCIYHIKGQVKCSLLGNVWLRIFRIDNSNVWQIPMFSRIFPMRNMGILCAKCLQK
jgi:hypothetical protein